METKIQFFNIFIKEENIVKHRHFRQIQRAEAHCEVLPCFRLIQ